MYGPSVTSWVTEATGGLARREVRRGTLRVVEGPDAGAELALEGRAVRVGSALGNDLRLSDETVSRHHLELRLDESGWRLEDLGSRNGTRVGGVRVKTAWLEPGARVEVGRSALELVAHEDRVEVPASHSDRFGMLVGRSFAMRELWGDLKRIAAADATVLLTGETGTGKEAVASTIVSHSSRAKGPLVVVDCGALTRTLVESELFGHEQGAFTGAARARPGAFERAHGGTVLLDEVGELPLDMQPKLLRVLESREVQRVGGHERRPVDFRLIAATHRSLEQMVNRGTFRADLFYRLAVLRVQLPPLRERPEDIPLLASHFLMMLEADPALLDDETKERLASYDWPGNVRELRNAVERLAFGAEPIVEPAAPSPNADEAVDLDTPFRIQKDRLVGRFELRYARALKDYSPDNLSRAARKAGMNRMAVVKLLTRHALLDEDG